VLEPKSIALFFILNLFLYVLGFSFVDNQSKAFTFLPRLNMLRLQNWSTKWKRTRIKAFLWTSVR